MSSFLTELSQVQRGTKMSPRKGHILEFQTKYFFILTCYVFPERFLKFVPLPFFFIHFQNVSTSSHKDLLASHKKH